MEAKRLIPYVIVILALAFALGSLPHGTPEGSLLFQSTWLLYLIYLGPVIVFGLMIAMIIFIGLSWRELGASIGWGMARRKRNRKPRSKYSLLIQLLVWFLAFGVLILRKGTIFNPGNSTTNSTITKIVGENATPPNPLVLGFIPGLSSLIQDSWFDVALLGLLVVGGLVLGRGVLVGLKEGNETNSLSLALRQTAGLELVNNALTLLSDQTLDARSRIIACYEKMIIVVNRLGAPMGTELTARELENRIRSTFALKGEAASALTQLFEEARYSLHDIDDDDAERARSSLESIARELQVQLDDK